jgi:hypothetical protein
MNIKRVLGPNDRCQVCSKWEKCGTSGTCSCSKFERKGENKELKTNIRGLSIICSDDGVWLSVIADSKKSEMLNLSNLAKKQGGIRGSALLEWCKQTAKESKMTAKKAKKAKKIDNLMRGLINRLDSRRSD